MKCSTCGEEHELLDPSFSRPDVIFTMSAEEKKDRVMESNDMCALRGEGESPDRYFVRCTLPVQLLDAPASRPELSLTKESVHPFARECLAGVCVHRVREWLDAMT
jgi:hypothetical protein